MEKVDGKTMTEFIGLIAKTCSYLTDDGSENKEAKGTKRCLKNVKIKQTT